MNKRGVRGQLFGLLFGGILAVALLVATSFGVNAQILPSFGGTRTGTTGHQFLKIGPDARSASLAGAVTATTTDPSAMSWNPAGIAGMDSLKWGFQGGFTRYFAEIGISHLQAVYRRGETFWGGSLIYLNSGDMPVTTEFAPQGTGQTFRVVNMALGLTFARQLTQQFRFGASAKYAHESLSGVTINNALVDLGFQYDIGLKGARFAVSVSNFGLNVSPSGTILVNRLNGATELSDFESVQAPAVFRIGLALDALKREEHLITAAVQLNHPTDNNETIAFGGEYSWKKLLFGRLGYEFGVDERGLPAFGVGLALPRRFGKATLDYGFNSKERLGNTHRFTLGVGIR
jgi:hypothetical protein